MDIRSALVGTAALVVAGFWAFVLMVLISGIGLIIILAAMFSVFLAIGVFLLMSAAGGVSGRAREKGASRTWKGLSALELTVLQMTSQRKTQQEIASATGVSQSVVAEKLDVLSKEGYLADNSLSEKGFQALRDTLRA